MRSLASREQNKKNAAYNLGVAEAMRIYKNEKPAFYVRLPKISVANTCPICIWIYPLYCRLCHCLSGRVKGGLCKVKASFWVRSCPASVSTLFIFTTQFLLDTMALVNDSNSQTGPGLGGGGQYTKVMPQEPQI